MGTVVIEQFNPSTKCWNKLYEVDSDGFDPNAPIGVDKYGGPYRHRIIGEEVRKEVVEEVPSYSFQIFDDDGEWE